MSHEENGRIYRWANVGEWYDWAIDNAVISEVELLEWLIEKGHVNFDMIQECFKNDMEATGFFVSTPADKDWPLLSSDYEEGTDAQCKKCDNEFDPDEVERLEQGEYPIEDIEEFCEVEEEDCPVKQWCKHKRKVGA